MKSSLIILSMLTFISASFANDGLVLESKMHEVLTLKKISKTRFEKMSSVVTGAVNVEITAFGETFKSSENLNNSDALNNFSIEVTGKNIIRIEDQKEKINQEIEADINKTLFGNIKAIKIDSKVHEGLYAESMKKAGLDILKKLQIANTKGTVLTSTIESGDVECIAEGDLLVCEQDALVAISLTAK